MNGKPFVGEQLLDETARAKCRKTGGPKINQIKLNKAIAMYSRRLTDCNFEEDFM